MITVSEDIKEIVEKAEVIVRKKNYYYICDESNKKSNKSLYTLMHAFGGFHTRNDSQKCWMFTYNPKNVLDNAFKKGFLADPRDNTDFLPTHIKLHMISMFRPSKEDNVCVFDQPNHFGSFIYDNSKKTDWMIVRPVFRTKNGKDIIRHAVNNLAEDGKMIILTSLDRGSCMEYSFAFRSFVVNYIESISWSESPDIVLNINLIYAVK